MVLGLFGKPDPVDTPQALCDFMDAQAAFLVQKSLYEHARYTAGAWRQLFEEDVFRQAAERARWGNYPTGLGHVAEMVLGVLRAETSNDAEDLSAGLEDCVRRVCARYLRPDAFPDDFWPDAAHNIGRRLRTAAARSVRPVHEIAGEGGREFFERLPIHPNCRGDDPDYVLNNVRSNLLQAHETFLRRADRTALAASLCCLKAPS
ncbi:MAG: hypothetical protein AAGL24_10530 [Pseudomonadota bacterium]